MFDFSLLSLQVVIVENVTKQERYVFTESILHLCGVQLDNTGNYTCIAENELGNANETAEFSVRDSHSKLHIFTFIHMIKIEQQ